MAGKPTVIIKKTDTKKNEATITGLFHMDENGRITLDTPDNGEVALEPIIEELSLQDAVVEIKLVLKDEFVDTIMYSEIA